MSVGQLFIAVQTKDHMTGDDKLLMWLPHMYQFDRMIQKKNVASE